MKYDVIVVGGGPGGLMAAKTAAEDGLKVLLIERKKKIEEINRACLQLFYIKWICPDAYIEPVTVENTLEGTKFHFLGPGFTVDYKGPLKPYCNAVWVSPCGNRVYAFKNDLFGFFYDKETFVAGLLKEVEKAGVEVLTETIAQGVENTADGVKVAVKTKAGDKTFEARKTIDASGHGSVIVESLGLNKDRKPLVGGSGGVGYVLEGVETEHRLNSWLCFTVPSCSAVGNVWMFMVSGDRNVVGTSAKAGESASEATDRFMKLPFFEPWFRHARIVKKLAFGFSALHLPLREPVVGNVLILGEATDLMETSNPGAIACGYQAAKASLKELNGQKGYADYIDWWQKAFEGNDPNYYKAAGRFMSLNSLCTDEEVDYLYTVIEGQIGVPAILVAQKLERVKSDRPALYEKLAKTGMEKGLAGMKMDYGDVSKVKED